MFCIQLYLEKKENIVHSWYGYYLNDLENKGTRSLNLDVTKTWSHC